MSIPRAIFLRRKSMQSMIIVGGTKEERKQKALEIANSQFQISNFDTIPVEGETSISIDQIRALFHKLSLKPYNSPAKAAIVHPAEILTVEAQNALLKMLEETSESSIIILTAPQVDSLLPTVSSRCQIIRLPAKSEITLSKEEVCSSIYDLSSIIQSGVGERLKIAGGLAKEREEIKPWFEKQIVLWREILLDKLGVASFSWRNKEGKEPNPQYIKLKFLTAGQIIKIIRRLEKTRSLLEQNVNPRLALEIFLLDLPSFS